MSLDRIETEVILLRQQVTQLGRLLDAFILPKLPKCIKCHRVNKTLDEDYCEACQQAADSPRKKGRKP